VSFGLTFEKLIIIGIIALVLIGPERLPRYAEQLGGWARQLREFIGGAQTRLRDEVGPEFDEIDWKQLDPRHYDPRRIIREALREPVAESATGAAGVSSAVAPGTAPARESAYAQRQRMLREGRPAPFDDEAT